MAKSATARGKPFSIRLSSDERLDLEHRAGNGSLAAYVKRAVFGADAPAPSRAMPTADRAALAQVLAMLGQTRLASNLNQLAKAVHSGSLIVDDATRDDLRRACGDVAAMRQLLLVALGIKADGGMGLTAIADLFRAVAGGPR